MPAQTAKNQIGNHSRSSIIRLFILVLLMAASDAFAQRPRIPSGGHLAVVADERLAALRGTPEPSARLLRRLNRGRFVSIRGSSRSRDGLLFYQVAVTRRTSGWLQSEAVVSSWRSGDDKRLFQLLEGADEFERVARARIFLNLFRRSPLRPRVLLIYGDAAEEAAAKLSREAERRFERRELPAEGAPEFSYYLNYSSLDRYNRQGVTFTFDRTNKRFHYEGWAWREIVRRHPKSLEAGEAGKRLTDALSAK
ncbi:MAG TPA: hypothetical protein VLR92_04430 [Blastocatellia bacterium]|nr:hypothetical protein [Blastocatellia bacterium]